MTEQTRMLRLSLPKLASWFERFDERGHNWVIVYWENIPPAQVRLNDIRPCAPIPVGDTTVRNFFTSRTAALRQSEASCQHVIQRSEEGHWGVWEWKSAGGRHYQSVLPFAAFEKQPEGTREYLDNLPVTASGKELPASVASSQPPRQAENQSLQGEAGITKHTLRHSVKKRARCFDFIYEPNRIQTYRHTGWNVEAGPIMIGPDRRDLRVRYYSQHIDSVVLRSLTDEECAQLPCPVVVVQLQTMAQGSVSSTPVVAQNGTEQKQSWFSALLAWLRR